MSKLNCGEESLKALRYAVLQKHGKIYGSLLEEVNLALRERAEKILKEIEPQKMGEATTNAS